MFSTSDHRAHKSAPKKKPKKALKGRPEGKKMVYRKKKRREPHEKGGWGTEGWDINNRRGAVNKKKPQHVPKAGRNSKR